MIGRFCCSIPGLTPPSFRLKAVTGGVSPLGTFLPPVEERGPIECQNAVPHHTLRGEARWHDASGGAELPTLAESWPGSTSGSVEARLQPVGVRRDTSGRVQKSRDHADKHHLFSDSGLGGQQCHSQRDHRCREDKQEQEPKQSQAAAHVRTVPLLQRARPPLPVGVRPAAHRHVGTGQRA